MGFESHTAARVQQPGVWWGRPLLSPAFLILDDLDLLRMTAQQSADMYELIIGRHRRSCFAMSSNRTVNEWLGLFDEAILDNGALVRWATPATR